MFYSYITFDLPRPPDDEDEDKGGDDDKGQGK